MATVFKLDDLITPLTRQQVQASIYSVLSTIGVNTTTWKPGAVVRAIIVGVSVVLAGLSSLQAAIVRSGWLELSEGDWLTAVALYMYGVKRVAATYATGIVVLNNSAGGVFNLAAGELVLQHATSGKQYRSTAAIALGAVGSASAVVVVPLRAVEAGSASSAAPSEVATLVTALTGVSVSSATAFVGTDAEDDVTLRLRCSEKLGALSPMGPWDAYAAAIRNASRPDGSRLGVTRMRTLKDGFGNVTNYVASASGEIDPSDVEIANAAVQQWAEPLAVNASAVSAVTKYVSVTCEVWLYNTSGLTDEQVSAKVLAALVAFTVAQPIGGNTIDTASGVVFVDALRAAIAGALPQIYHVTLAEPAADVDVNIGQVPVLSPSTTVSVHQVAPPEGMRA